MGAGYNLRINVWRITQQDDDYVGGSVITGTVLHYGVQARMQEQEEEQVLLQQGLETMKTFTMNIIPGTLDVQERDEVEIVFPPTHKFLNDRFRVRNLRYSDLTDPRAYIMLTLSRNVRAHTEQ